MSDKEAAEVGRLIVSKEDSLFGLDTDPGRAISRDTVCQASLGGELMHGRRGVSNAVGATLDMPCHA